MPDIHERAPWKDVTLVGGYWDCADRLEKLLVHVRPWFRQIVAVVQESPDNTLEVARRHADVVLQDSWHRRGDPSIHMAMSRVETKYALVVSDDEWPDEALLGSFQDLVNEMRTKNVNGAWLPFRHWIDDFEFDPGHHLRFFESRLGWPNEPHARPPTDNTLQWGIGTVEHRRSLDEMIQDYLLRTEIDGHLEGVQKHNLHMMERAITKVADRRGGDWAYVKGFPWWDRVVDLIWGGKQPAGSEAPPEAPQAPEEPEVAPEPPSRRPGRPRGSTRRKKS